MGLSLLAVVVSLTLIHSILLVLFYQFDKPGIYGLLLWFDLDIERNVPSVYSSLALFVSSVLFFVIGMCHKKSSGGGTTGWFGLALVFLFLSADEGFKIHENIGDIVEDYVKATGFVYFPWIIPYGFAVVALALAYLKFMLKLPRETAVRFLLSGIIYLTGAAVFDMLGGRAAELHGYDSVLYSVLYTIEEFLEMIAIVALIHALLLYMERQFGRICITFRMEGIKDDPS